MAASVVLAFSLELCSLRAVPVDKGALEVVHLQLFRVRAPKDPGQAAQLLPMCPDEVEVVDGGSRADAL